MSKIIPINATLTEPIITPFELQQELPASHKQITFIEKSKSKIRKILNLKDPRLLLIVGPCSIHDITAAKEYATKLKQLSDSISETFILAMRVYFEKSRTSLGWKGLLYDPFLDGSNDLNTGICWTRELLLELANMEVPVASEFLDPISCHYFGDLISWGCIGARTSSSQIHRQMASGFDIPIGFKNSTDGNIEVAVRGAMSASAPHSFVGVNESGQSIILHTKGNPDTHVVLRGSENSSNYDPGSINFTLECLKQFDLTERVVIDCSHGNSNRNHENQPKVFQSIIKQIVDGNKRIKGMILESHLHSGKQILSTETCELEYGVSITDSCLDWSTTERLIKWGQRKLHDEIEKEIEIDEETNDNVVNNEKDLSTSTPSIPFGMFT